MKKIPTLFVRNPDDRAHVLPEITPGCEWVAAGEGRATRKWDGTCTLLDEDGEWWARREVKPGKNIPSGYRIEQHDETTGKLVGWEPMAQSSFAKFHADAATYHVDGPGTYELVGPKINGNPDRFDGHALIPHGYVPAAESADIEAAPRDYDGLRAWLLDRPYEGIVWHHPDGRMAKLKRRDFPRPEPQR
ncbi:RNA ligase 1 family protein [Streptomyces canus]